MNRKKTRVIVSVLVIALSFFSISITTKSAKASAYSEIKDYAVRSIKSATTDPSVGFVGGEWAILTLGKAGEASADIKEKYHASVKNAVAGATDGKLSASKASDNERVIIGLSAIGDKPMVEGVDLAAPLYDVSYTTKQGINGAIFGLIALDMSGYYRQSEAENQTSAEDPESVRDDLIRYILARETAGGGWSFTGAGSDPDITFMVIQSLAPYYGKDDSVKASVDRALSVMSEKQDAEGGFSTSLSGNVTSTSESVSQAITALTSLGIDPAKDERFIKNGKTLIDKLLSFRVEGGYAHTGASLDRMATEQAAYASVALWLFESGKHLYDRVGEIYRATDVPIPTVSPAPTQSPVPTATPTPTVSPTPASASQTKVSGVTYEVKGTGVKVTHISNKTTVKIKDKVTIAGKSYKVTHLAKGACKGLSKTKKLKVTCKALKKVEKCALDGLNKNAVIYLPKKKYVLYVKMFKKKNTGYKKTMKFKKI